MAVVVVEERPDDDSRRRWPAGVVDDDLCVLVDSKLPDQVSEGLGLWHRGPGAQAAEGVAIKVNGTGNVVASVVLVRPSIDDANRRIGQVTGEPNGLGQELRMTVAALTNRNGHSSSYRGDGSARIPRLPPLPPFHPCPGKPRRVRFPLARSPAGLLLRARDTDALDAPYQGLLDHAEVRGDIMSIPRSVMWIAALLGITLIASTEQAVAQNSSNRYAIVDDWAKLPGGREMGAVGKATIDPDGRHIWAVVRCDAGAERFGDECRDSDLDPVLKFDPDGNMVESFGGGLFIWPHGIDVDSDGNVWVTDGVGSGNIPEGDDRGHRVIKFSGRGEVLMILGTGGEEGGGRNHFTSPSDVAIAENGDIFVADGHGNGNNRVVKFNRRGEFLMSWGQTGYGPGEFRSLHAIDIDPSGRVFVGDRSNSRIQIFDQQGNHIATWTQFGRPSGIALRQ